MSEYSQPKGLSSQLGGVPTKVGRVEGVVPLVGFLPLTVDDRRQRGIRSFLSSNSRCRHEALNMNSEPTANWSMTNDESVRFLQP